MDDYTQLYTQLYTDCGAAISGKLNEVVLKLKKSIGSDESKQRILVDIFCLIDTETSQEKGTRDSFFGLIKECLSQGIVPDHILKELMDNETLENLGLLRSKQAFQQRYVRMKTRLFYKQQKFNLFREENEGFSKLITELNVDFNKDSMPQLINCIESLIGCFSLDPNRVLDIVLESYENRPEQHFVYTYVMKHFNFETGRICQMLGFKFQNFANETTPPSLYILSALLIRDEIIQLNALWPHLSPPDTELSDMYDKDIDTAKEQVKKLNVVSLGGAEKDPEKELKSAEKFNQVKYEKNQKLAIVEALFRVGAWDHADIIIRRFPDYFAMTRPSTARALCEIIHLLIEKVYQEHSGLQEQFSKAPTVSSTNNPFKIVPCETLHEFVDKVFPLLSYLGPHLSIDPCLFGRIIRLCITIAKKCKSESDSGFNMGTLITILDIVLIPSLTMMFANCCMAELFWQLLSLIPYHDRYCLYGRWREKTYYKHPALIRVMGETLHRTKYLMKRLTKDSVKQTGRQIGKLSHCNPTIVFQYTLLQTERYDSFIGPVLDSLKYLTTLSYDVLIYCLIGALADPVKQKTKHDEMNISLWMQNLALFAGQISKKYTFELAGLLQYVGNQLKCGKSADLLILREVLHKMTGIEITEDLTVEQLECMMGGDFLKQEGGYFLQVRNTKKSSARLKEALVEYDLAIPLSILIAQQRDSIVYHEDAQNKHLKLVGMLYDNCQNILIQLGNFLAMQLNSEELITGLPPVQSLLVDYHLPPDAAFFLSRMLHAQTIQAKFDELRKEEKPTDTTKDDFRVECYIKAVEYVLERVADDIKPAMDTVIWNDINAHFYATFWFLSASDLHVPDTAYLKQIESLHAQMKSLDENLEMTSAKKKKEKERCQGLINKIRQEEKAQSEKVRRVHEYIRKHKDDWFTRGNSKNETIIQQCIIPRMLFSPIDAMYCSKFIALVHDMRAKNFTTLLFYDKIFCDITCYIGSCTEDEAHRYGRFLGSSLDILMKWHSTKEMYEENCNNTPGFMTVVRRQGSDSSKSPIQLDYENFRNVCHKWHFRITKAVINCLKSDNYVQMRNAIIVLTKIADTYPKLKVYGKAVEGKIDEMIKQEKEKRPDIYALAMGYFGQLKARKGHWVNEEDFHIPKTKPAPATPIPEEAPKPQVAEKDKKPTTAEKPRKVSSHKSKKSESNSHEASSKSSKSKKASSGEKRRKDEDVIKIPAIDGLQRSASVHSDMSRSSDPSPKSHSKEPRVSKRRQADDSHHDKSKVSENGSPVVKARRSHSHDRAKKS